MIEARNYIPSSSLFLAFGFSRASLFLSFLIIWQMAPGNFNSISTVNSLACTKCWELMSPMRTPPISRFLITSRNSASPRWPLKRRNSFLKIFPSNPSALSSSGPAYFWIKSQDGGMQIGVPSRFNKSDDEEISSFVKSHWGWWRESVFSLLFK